MTFCNANKPKAQLSGNNLVLSLPDAMTPVVWMIDTKTSGSFFMRIEEDANGLFILQKIEGTGKEIKIEDIAYYKNKYSATQAMNKIGRVLDSADRQPSAKGKIFATVLITTIFLVLLALAGLYALGKGWINPGQPLTAPQNTAQQSAPPPVIGNTPDAVGVPLSADEYMNQNNSGALPF